MHTITTRSDYNDLEGRARTIALNHIASVGIEDATIESIDLDDDLSCQMSVSYDFSYRFPQSGGASQCRGYVTFFANNTHLVQLAPPHEDATPKEAEWLLVYGGYGDALIYTLREEGFRRGTPVMVNDITIRVDRASKSTSDISPVVDKILAALQ